MCWSCALDIHLIDGTYELFRHYYALPSARDQDGREVAAVRGVLASVLGMIKGGATHIAVATDHVIESFRNDLWPGYKTGEGIEPDLLAQFPLLEDVLSAAGIVVWPMVEFEADDALAAAAVAAARDARVERVIICTPDKDLAQCVRGTRIVQLNRRTRVTLRRGRRDQEIRRPAGIDPRLSGAGGRCGRRLSGAAGLGREVVGCRPRQVCPSRIHSGGLARVARERRQRECPRSIRSARERDRALLFRTLATLRTDIALFDDVDQLRWNGPTDAFEALAARLDAAQTETRRSGAQRSRGGS